MTVALDVSSLERSFAAPRHLKVTGPGPAFGFEPCEDAGCAVDLDGTATSCGRLACPACGCGGTNLVAIRHGDPAAGSRVGCTCGYSWLRGAGSVQTLPRAAAVD